MKQLQFYFSLLSLTVVFSANLSIGQQDSLTLFINGDIVTMAPDSFRAEAIAVRGEKILWVGTNEEVLNFSKPGTRVFDMEGKTVIPGFVDAHTHVFNDNIGGSLKGSQEIALENGITTLGNMFVTYPFMEEMKNFYQSGQLKIKTSLYLIYNTNCGNIEGDWYKDHPPTRIPGELLRIGGVKVFTDGGTCGKRAALSFPRPNGNFGDLFFEQEELNKVIHDIHNSGYQTVIHAVGDTAIALAQNAVEFALDGAKNALRHRIDHNSIIKPHLLPRYGEIGVIPVVFGWYGTCIEAEERGWIRSVGYERRSFIYPIRELIEANPGLTIAWHGDDPWVGPVSPIEELYHMVTRKEVKDDGTICNPPEWMLRTKLSPLEALRMMTTGSAYALDRDQEVGSLEPGKYADFLILSANPLDIDPDEIRNIEIMTTVANGKKVYGMYPFEITTNTSIAERDPFELKIFPNPFSREITLQYNVIKTGQMEVYISDQFGRTLKHLVDQRHTPGLYSTNWDGKDDNGILVSGGIYSCTIKSGEMYYSRLIVLIR